MNSRHRRTLEAVFANPANGNMEWRKIEALLKAIGCTVIEGAGSAVRFEYGGRCLAIHRPHAHKEALACRVSATREFLIAIGITL